MWIGFLAVILSVVFIALFACNNANKSGESSSGGFGGLIAKTENKNVLVQVGNTTVTMDDVMKDPRFKQLLADKIFSAILVDKGQKDRIEITEEDVDKQIAKIKKQFPDPALFEKQLKDSGYTMETLRIEQRKYLVLDRLLRQKLQMTDEDLRDFYDQNKRYVDQSYASQNGLTEEETLNLNFETVRDVADQLYIDQKGQEVFTTLREELIREYFDTMKFFDIPPMTLADFQIADSAATPPEEGAAGGTTEGGKAEGAGAAGAGAGNEGSTGDTSTGSGEGSGGASAGDAAGDGKDSASGGEGGATTPPPAEGGSSGK
jgi:hypothetical protein